MYSELTLISLVVVQSLCHVRLFETPWTTDARLLCLPLSPRVCSDSCSWSWWCHLTISSWSLISHLYCNSSTATVLNKVVLIILKKSTFTIPFSLLKKYLFAYLAASCLSCSTQDLHCVMRHLSLQRTDFLVVSHGLRARRLSSCSCEMEISPAILINILISQCHSHQCSLASKSEWGLPKLWSSRCCQPSTVIAEELGESKKQGEQGNRISPR